MRVFRQRESGEDMSIMIIAEAGVNHNGSMELAKQMIDAAKDAGVDYIKFQTFIPEKLVSKFAAKADYQKEILSKDTSVPCSGNKETLSKEPSMPCISNKEILAEDMAKSEESQLDMLRNLALTQQEFKELKLYCDKVEIGFLSTPFDLPSIDFLQELDMDFWKIPSGEITNLPYLEKIAKTKRKTVMSTGMCNMQEIQDAITVLEKNGTTDITLLHCNTEYPTPFCDVNLRAMEHMRRELKKPVGYSDHTVGIEVPIAAAALGAVVIEKHFTLDKTMEGPDHRASLEPVELKQMTKAIRNIENSLGDGIKKRTASEEKNCTAARKSIVAACDIARGDIFSERNLAVKRPGNGISPMKWKEILGTAAQKDYKADELI